MREQEDPHKFQLIESFFLLLFVGLLVAAPIFAFQLYKSGWEPFHEFKFWTKYSDTIRNMLLAAAGLVGAVFGVFQLYNSAKRTRVTAISARTGQEAERNDRFVKAAGLLSHDDASVRMAGVFALERLAREDGANYAGTVIDVLAGFVRERTTRKDYPPRPKDEYYPFGDEKDREAWGPPTEPVKAAVTALSKICRAIFETDGRVIAVDLRGAQLPQLEANTFFMRKWLFDGANLQDAQLWDANLQDAQLWDANLQGASLWVANLQSAGLVGANLQEARLAGANLQGAQLLSANLQGAGLALANLQDANVDAAELSPDQLDAAIWPTDAPPTLPAI